MLSRLRTIPSKVALQLWQSNGSPGSGATATIMNSKQLNTSRNADGSIPLEQSNSCKAWQMNGDGRVKEDHCVDTHHTTRKTETLGSSTQLCKMQASASMPDGGSVVNKQEHHNDQLVNAGASLASGMEHSNGRACLDNTSGLTQSRPNVEGGVYLPSSEGGDSTRLGTSTNGTLTEGTKVQRYQEESVGHLKVEREEGELFPNGDFEEDNFAVYRDAGLEAMSKGKDGGMIQQYQNRHGEEEVCGEGRGENDADADDESEENNSGLPLETKIFSRLKQQMIEFFTSSKDGRRNECNSSKE